MNFVRNDLSKKIIQYHEDFNDQGHVTIRNSAITLDICKSSDGIDKCENEIKMDHSIQVGKILWIIVKSKYGKCNFRPALQIF